MSRAWSASAPETSDPPGHPHRRQRVINYDEVFPLLVAACPSFEDSVYAAHDDENDGEFLRVGRLVVHLIELLDRDETNSFPAVFGIVEWALEEGSDDARMLVSDGLLHDLTNQDLYVQTAKHPSDFVSWLGPCAQQQPAIQPFL
ncbi:MAG: hypothetical protein JWO37_1197 [Acidimicrobiales bacterium]|jgi:hypothetical protein|nr:hypothetical protein [Acidimicrobiales bacterium]